MDFVSLMFKLGEFLGECAKKLQGAGHEEEGYASLCDGLSTSIFYCGLLQPTGVHYSRIKTLEGIANSICPLHVSGLGDYLVENCLSEEWAEGRAELKKELARLMSQVRLHLMVKAQLASSELVDELIKDVRHGFPGLKLEEPGPHLNTLLEERFGQLKHHLGRASTEVKAKYLLAQGVAPDVIFNRLLDSE